MRSAAPSRLLGAGPVIDATPQHGRKTLARARQRRARLGGMEGRLLEAIKDGDPMSTKVVAETANLPLYHAKKGLVSLVASRRIHSRGVRRSQRWHLGPAGRD